MAELDPLRYDELAEAGTFALRAIPNAVIFELERRSEHLILRHMFMEMTIKQALRVQAALAAAIEEAVMAIGGGRTGA